MFNNSAKFEIEYEYKGTAFKRSATDSSDYTAVFHKTENAVELRILPKKELHFSNIKLTFSYCFKEGARAFLNGYQSWTNCREVTKEDKVAGIKPLAAHLPPIRKVCEYFGDYTFHKYGGKGVFHGYTYGYVRNGAEVTLIGSMSEDSGFTVITFDMKKNKIVIEKEVEGLVTDVAFTAFDLRAYQGGYEAVFDQYFQEMQIKKPRLCELNGYTSWYNYFQKIDRNIILNDLVGLSAVQPAADIFQIDDGWQTKVGDWLSVDMLKFPNGMGEIAEHIHGKHMLAGLWLAPFLTEKKSELAREHRDWLLKDKKGKLLLGNIGWSGAYILDFYNEEVRAYLKKTFRTVLDEWGYDLVKLDFLYAVCLHPRQGKCRGQIMAEAMAFLRELVGTKLILGCGVPLGSAFGRVDLCRISADVDLSYRERFYSRLSNREIISTRCALENTIFRRHLDGRAFGNDPDVFFLRDEKIKFTESQKLTLSTVNSMLGTVRFVSDNIGTYDKHQKALLSAAFARKKVKLLSADMAGNHKSITIAALENGEKKQLVVPLK